MAKRFATQEAAARWARNKAIRDEDYIRWLSDPEKTISTELRLEIARRLKELTQ